MVWRDHEELQEELQKQLQEKTLLLSVDALMKIGYGQVRDSDEVYLRHINAFSGYACKLSIPAGQPDTSVSPASLSEYLTNMNRSVNMHYHGFGKAGRG